MKSKGICFILLWLICLNLKASDYYKVNVSKVNIRAGAGKDFATIGSLSLGDKVLIDSIISDWGQVIIYGKLKGYVAIKYLSKISDTTSKNNSSGNLNGNPSSEKSSNPWKSILTLIILGIIGYYQLFGKKTGMDSIKNFKSKINSNKSTKEQNIELDYIAEVRLVEGWYRVYNAKGKQLSLKGKHSKAILQGYSDRLIVIEDGGWYRVYNSAFKQISIKGRHSNEKFLSVAGNSITIQENSWIKTYDENFKQMNIRAAH